MKHNLLSEDIQRFKSIIKYDPSYGFINESTISTIFKNLTGDALKSTFRTFLKDTLKVDLKNIGKTNITLISKNNLTKDGEKFVQKILSDAGQTTTFNSLKKEEKLAAFRMVQEAQKSIDSKIISKLGGNVSKETVSKAFVAMTKSQKLTKESIDEILKNFGKKDFLTSLKGSNKSLLVLDDISQSVFKKPYSALSQVEKDSLRRTINGMNPKKLKKALAQQLVAKTDPSLIAKLKKLWGGSKRIPKSKLVKWGLLIGLSVASIYAIIKFWDDDVTTEEDEKKQDDGGGGGGGNNGGGGGGGSTSYTQCSDFPYKKNCSSPIVAEVQKCLGLYNDGKFGPKTEAKLNQLGYGSEITKEVYDKIKEKCGTNTVSEPIKVNPEYVDPNKIVYTDTDFENL